MLCIKECPTKSIYQCTTEQCYSVFQFRYAHVADKDWFVHVRAEQSSEIDKCRKEGLGGVGVETSVSRLGHTVIAAG